MSIKTSMVLNSFRMIISMIFPLITFPYVTRTLSVEGIGQVYFVNSFLSLFLVFAIFGIPIYGIREFAKVKEDLVKRNKIFNELFFLNISFSLIAYVIFIIFVIYNPELSSLKLLFVIAGFKILLTPLNLEWVYQAMENYIYITIRTIIIKIISLITIFIFVKSEEDFLTYFIILILSDIVAYIMNFIYAKKYINTNILILNKNEFAYHLKPVIVLFAISFSTTIYESLDNVLLGLLTNNLEVGYYSVANKLLRIIIAIIVSISIILLPRMTNYLKNNDMLNFRKTARKTLDLLLFITLPAAFLFAIFSREIIIILSGEKYLPATFSSIILSPEIIILVIGNLIGVQILIAAGREKQTLYSCVYGAIASVLLNILLIPQMGNVGAAISNLISQTVVTISMMYFARDLIGDIFFEIGKIKYLVLSSILSFILFFVKINTFVEPIYLLIYLTIPYLLVYYLILLLCKDHIAVTIGEYFMRKIKL